MRQVDELVEITNPICTKTDFKSFTLVSFEHTTIDHNKEMGFSTYYGFQARLLAQKKK